MTITWKETRQVESTLYVSTTGECQREATEEDLRRACGVLGLSLTNKSTVEHEREIASRDRRIAELEAGSTVAHVQALQAAHRQAIDDLRIARAERDEARDRCIRAAQILVEEFGTDVPMNVEEAAERAVLVVRAAEQERDTIVNRICAMGREELMALGLVPIHVYEEALLSRQDSANLVGVANERIAELECDLISAREMVDMLQSRLDQERTESGRIDMINAMDDLLTDRDAARAERDNAARMARDATDTMHDALAERDAIVDRICAAVRIVGGTVVIGDMYFGGFGVVTDVFADRIRDEIRKAAKGGSDGK